MKSLQHGIHEDEGGYAKGDGSKSYDGAPLIAPYIFECKLDDEFHNITFSSVFLLIKLPLLFF